jgi:sugar lactone lactonase YvrE
MAVYGRNLYVTDTGTETIRRIEIDGDHTVTTIAGINWCNGSADGTGTEATFGGPYGITTDGQNLYITDIWHYNIRKMVIETGVVTTLIGLVDHPGWADGASDEATFFRPQFIDYFGGSLFVSEANNDIRKIE